MGMVRGSMEFTRKITNVYCHYRNHLFNSYPVQKTGRYVVCNSGTTCNYVYLRFLTESKIS